MKRVSEHMGGTEGTQLEPGGESNYRCREGNAQAGGAQGAAAGAGAAAPSARGQEPRRSFPHRLTQHRASTSKPALAEYSAHIWPCRDRGQQDTAPAI